MQGACKMVTQQATAQAVSKTFPGQVCVHCIKLTSLLLQTNVMSASGLLCCCAWFRQPMQYCNKVDTLRRCSCMQATVNTILTQCLTAGHSGLPSGHLSNFLAPGSPSDSISASPTAMELHGRRHLIANDASGSNQGGARDAGPRIFVGKLVRGTTETDVRDYFSKFG